SYVCPLLIDDEPGLGPPADDDGVAGRRNEPAGLAVLMEDGDVSHRRRHDDLRRDSDVRTLPPPPLQDVRGAVSEPDLLRPDPDRDVPAPTGRVDRDDAPVMEPDTVRAFDGAAEQVRRAEEVRHEGRSRPL